MITLLNDLKSMIYPTADLRTEEARLEHSTRAVFAVIGLSLAVSTLAVIFLDLTAQNPQIWPMFLMAALFALHLSAWFLLQSGKWQIARYFPPFLFLMAGAVITVNQEVETVAILQFVLCILSTSILFGISSQWVSIILCSVTYLVVSHFWSIDGTHTEEQIRYVNIMIFGSVGILQQITSGVISQTIKSMGQETENRKKTEESAQQKENILSAIAHSAQLLLDAQDWKTKIDEMLALLGAVSGASHAYVFQNHTDEDGKLISSLKYEWGNLKEGFTADTSEFQNIPLLEEEMIEWYNLLITGEPFYESTEWFPPEWSEHKKERKGIKTLLDVPIFVDREWWGVIGFDDYRRIKPWSQAEVDALQIAAGLLGSAIKRQRSTEALTASENKFQKTFHQTLIPMVICRLSDKVILDANNAFGKLTGYPQAQLINRWASELNLWQNNDEYSLHHKLIRENGFIHEFKTTLRKRNGEIGTVLLSVTTVSINNEDCLLYTISDISGLEKALNDLQSKNSELERFTYTVSHDLKAPLITIGGFMGLLEKDLASGNIEKINNSARRIRDAVIKMERLLNELLELSRIGRMVNEPIKVSFEGIVKEALSLVQGRLSANRVEVRVEPGMPLVKVDRARLVEVMQNLLDNSSKFIGTQTQPEIKIGTRRSMDSEYIFFVSDNGIGIEPAYHERVFGLFNKLDANTEGTGIGLALARRIIEYHGGRIWVESDGKDKGATFCFTLPRP